jgi:hypothetical protein
MAMNVQGTLLDSALQYAMRMVEGGYATIEQAAAMCGLSQEALEQALSAAERAPIPGDAPGAGLQKRLGWRE